MFYSLLREAVDFRPLQNQYMSIGEGRTLHDGPLRLGERDFILLNMLHKNKRTYM